MSTPIIGFEKILPVRIIKDPDNMARYQIIVSSIL